MDEEELEDQATWEEEPEETTEPDVQAMVTAAVESERQKLQAEFDSRFERDKREFQTSYGKRFDQVVRTLREEGRLIDEHGNISPPSQAPATVGAQQQAAIPEEVLIDPYDTAEVMTQKVLTIAERMATQRTAALEQEIKLLKQGHLQVRQALSPPVSRVQQFLADTAPWAEGDEEFSRQFRSAVAQIPEEAPDDDRLLEMAAGVALANTRAAYRARGEPIPKAQAPDTAQQESARRAALNRSGLAQTGSTRGSPPEEPVTDVEIAFLKEGWPKEWGPMTPATLRALSDDPSGQKYRDHMARHSHRRTT